MIRVDERALVAEQLAGGPVARDLVDKRLQAVADGETLLCPFRTLVTVPLEVVVAQLGGAGSDVEQLRREGSMRRAA